MDARSTYEGAAIGERRVVACMSSEPEELIRFQVEVTYLDQKEVEGRIRISERHLETLSGLSRVICVGFTKLG